MSLQFENSQELVTFSTKQKLYKMLIEQLEKDFNFSGIELTFRKNCAPTSLVMALEKRLKQLINSDFAGYLNLLYRIDVSERDIRQTDGSDIDVLVNQVTFLILRREWQKVWMRSKSKS